MDSSQRHFPLSSDANTSMINFLNAHGGESFLLPVKQMSSRNLLSGTDKERTIIHLKRFDTGDLSSPKAQRALLDGLRDGTVGIQQANGKVVLSSKMLSRQAKVILAARHLPFVKKIKTEESSIPEHIKTSSSEAEEPGKLKKSKIHAEGDSHIEESYTYEEGEEIDSFDVISDEDYDRFLAQINKILNKEDQEKDSSDATEQAHRQTSRMDRDGKKNTVRENLLHMRATAKVRSTKEDREDEMTEKAADEKEARLQAAQKRDEKAAEKKRLFIKDDHVKSGIKSSDITKSVKSETEIDKTVLDSMVKNKEISEEAREAFENSANIDEAFLAQMHKKGLIDKEAYNTFIKMLTG